MLGARRLADGRSTLEYTHLGDGNPVPAVQWFGQQMLSVRAPLTWAM